MPEKYLINAKKLRHRKIEPSIKVSYHGGKGMELTGHTWIKIKDGKFIKKENLT